MAYHHDEIRRLPRPVAYDNRSNNLSISSSNSGNSLTSEIHKNFRPRRIIVFKNGDEFDTGIVISVTRQQFQHWVSLIDYLTAKLKPTTAFNKLFTISGEEIRHLKDLSDGESYVAASSVFKPLPYQFKIKGKDWSRSAVPKAKDITNLSSTETMKIYLKKNNFKPLTTNQCWDDSGFDLLRTSHGRVANNHSYPTTGQALPQRSQVAYSQPNISRLQLNQPVFSNGRRSASVDRFRAVDQYNRSNTGPQRYH